jgi:hypothetical protein
MDTSELKDAITNGLRGILTKQLNAQIGDTLHVLEKIFPDLTFHVSISVAVLEEGPKGAPKSLMVDGAYNTPKDPKDLLTSPEQGRLMAICLDEAAAHVRRAEPFARNN